MHRSVPTQNDILVPETLLKKRKSQEKARAERQAAVDAQKKVCYSTLSPYPLRHDAQHTLAN